MTPNTISQDNTEFNSFSIGLPVSVFPHNRKLALCRRRCCSISLWGRCWKKHILPQAWIKWYFSLNDYQLVNPVSAEIIGCQENFLYLYYLAFLSIAKQNRSGRWLVNSFFFSLTLKFKLKAFFFPTVSLSEQIGVIKVNLEVSGKVLDI